MHPNLKNDINLLDHFILESEEIQLFKNADVVWVGYVNFYNMSGVIVQAGMMRKPILASKAGLIGALTDKYELGISADINCIKDVIAGLKTLSNAQVAANFGLNGYKIFHDHTPTQFKKTIELQFTTCIET